MSRPTDPGPGFLAGLRDALMVDPAWRVESSRSFTWWPHDFSQHVSAGEAFTVPAGVGCRLVVETEVLRVPKPSPALDGLLVELMRHPAMSAFRVDAATGKVSLFSGAVVQDDTAAEVLPLLAVSALLQATYASLGRPSLVRLTGFPPATSRHPSSGDRPSPDDLLRLAGKRILPAGEAASRYADAGGLSRAAAVFASRGAAVRESGGGLSARFPFESGAPEPLAPAVSSLLQLRHDERHPELGAGVFFRLFLPSAAAREAAAPATLALRLNDLERRSPAFRAATLGSWCLEQSDPEVELPVLPGPPRLCHVTFLPNYVRTPGALEAAAADAALRAEFARRVFASGAGVE